MDVTPEAPREPRTYVLVLAVAVVAAAVFATAIGGPFLYDDRPLIADNPYVQSFAWWPRWWTTDFWHISEDFVRFGNRMVYWRPLISASYAVDWQLGGGSPIMFHLTNTLAQAGMGALSFVVLRRWIGATWPALVAALLFAVHPTKAESVAWIAGRTDVFCMIGVFVATIGVGRRLRGERGGLALEIAGTLFAYTTKEQAIVLPMFVAVEVWVAGGRPAIDKTLVWKIVRAAWPQAAVAIAYFVFRALWLPIRAANTEDFHIPLASHLLAILETLGRFVALVVAPRDLSIQQGLVHYRTDLTFEPTPSYVVLGGAAVLAAATIMVLARKRWPVVTLGLGFFFATLAPTSNLVYTQMATLVSERFLYLPVLGLALIVGVALARLSSRRFAAYAIAGLVIGLLSIQSLRRSADYADETRFWAREAELHPDSRLAYAYLVKQAIDTKQYRRALELELAVQQLGVAERAAGQLVSAEQELELADQIAELVANLTPDRDTATLRAIDAFAAALLAGEEARLVTSAVALTYPRRASTKRLLDKKNFRGRLLVLRATLMSRMSDDAAALDFARQALATCERCRSMVPTVALTFARAGRYVEALEIFDRMDGSRDQETLRKTRGHIERAFASHEAAASATGPQQLQQWAQELAALELWGRAYAVLAPHKDAIKKAPSFALGFAELAYRAGDAAVAREVLAAQGTSDIDGALDEWAAEMGWK